MVSSTAQPVPRPLLIGLPIALLVALIAGLISITVVFGAASTTCDGPEAVGALNSKVPRWLGPIYVRAASEYELGTEGPAVLASINEIETRFGQANTVSSAGAEGWMQFMPETWAAYGVDANRDGKRDPYDPEDAIFAAANYLHASGAPEDWRAAIFAYNHAGWYVEEVLAGAKRYTGQGTATAVEAESATCTGADPAGPRVAKMVAEADRLSRLRPYTEYVYGGSHGVSPTPMNGPFDCSSAVSHILQVAGFDNPTMDTTALLGWAEPGPGKWVTIYNKPYGEDAHTFFRFEPGVTPPSKRFWGTSGMWFSGHGPGWIPQRIFSAEYLSGFQLQHPPGL
jgi:hypothetical protein